MLLLPVGGAVVNVSVVPDSVKSMPLTCVTPLIETSRLLMFPGFEGSLIWLNVQMRKVQGVISNLPECIAMFCAGPQISRASLKRFVQHRERCVILAL